MSDLIDTRKNRAAIREYLLATASTLAVLSALVHAPDAQASDNDADHPVLWLELGGQLEQQTGQGDSFAPPAIANDPSAPAFKPVSPFQSEKPPMFSNGAEAALSFQPEDSNWVLSASVRYGRANGSKIAYHNTPGHKLKHVNIYATYPPGAPHYATYRVFHCCKTSTSTNAHPAYADTKAANHDSHAILDFQVGRDFGLGLFGRSGDAVLSGGVRFVQFSAKSNVTMHGQPDVKFFNGAPPFILNKYPQVYYPASKFHIFGATAQSERSFQGLGPSLSWKASTELLGNAQAGEFSFDWGANVAVLFGRRKAQGQHHQSGHYHHDKYYPANLQYYSHSTPFNRRKSVTVPNVGGFAGVSFKFVDAKVSLGYRGDFFFGAMDTGWDKEKNKTVGFYGPFATISFGFGG